MARKYDISSLAGILRSEEAAKQTIADSRLRATFVFVFFLACRAGRGVGFGVAARGD